MWGYLARGQCAHLFAESQVSLGISLLCAWPARASSTCKLSRNFMSRAGGFRVRRKVSANCFDQEVLHGQSDNDGGCGHESFTPELQYHVGVAAGTLLI